MQPEHTHKQTQLEDAGRDGTLSFTIASQTIASSPDGSEISSAATSAVDTDVHESDLQGPHFVVRVVRAVPVIRPRLTPSLSRFVSE